MRQRGGVDHGEDDRKIELDPLEMLCSGRAPAMATPAAALFCSPIGSSAGDGTRTAARPRPPA
jgi:hypothetical protein